MQGTKGAFNPLLTGAIVPPKVRFMLGRLDDVYEIQKETDRGRELKLLTIYWETLEETN